MRMLHNYLRIVGTTFSAFVALFGAGCFAAIYPETYDASDFEEFAFRVDYPSCLDIPSTPGLVSGRAFVCQATIIRESTGEYLVQLTVRPFGPPPLIELPQRVMTGEEAEHFLAESRELHINRHPRPFCTIPFPYELEDEVFLRWDGLELVLIDCDRARLELGQVDAIERFLNTLLPDTDAGSP